MDDNDFSYTTPYTDSVNTTELNNTDNLGQPNEVSDQLGEDKVDSVDTVNQVDTVQPSELGDGVEDSVKGVDESIEDENGMDIVNELERELENELEDEFDDLENELERELMRDSVAITQTSEPEVEKKRDFVFGEAVLFGEFGDSSVSEVFNSYDYEYKWTKFRGELDHKLRLSDFVEFDQLVKRGVQSDFSELEVVQNPTLVKLYTIGKTNLKLLLHFKSPEVSAMIGSLIYDLNSSNVIYSKVHEDFDLQAALPGSHKLHTISSINSVNHTQPNNSVKPSELGKLGQPSEVLGDLGDSVKPSELGDVASGVKESSVVDESGKIGGSGRESDVRRQWRKRLQTMSKETRLALVNMGKSLKYIENAFINIESSRTYDSMVEYCEVNSQFKICDYLSVLNHSFDPHYSAQNPHESAREDEILNKRELIHTRVARNLVNILPVVGQRARVHFSRFHRLDFRTSVFSTIMHNYISACLSGKKRRVRELEIAPNSELYGQVFDIRWRVNGLVESVIGVNYKDDDMVDGIQNHCSNYFVNSSDLSLVDDLRVILLEYVEQYPLLLNNLGMVSRIDSYVNGESGLYETVLGNVVNSAEYELFGVSHKLEENELQSVLDNTLFKAPIFYQNHPSQGVVRSNDLTGLGVATEDFILVRSSSEGGERLYIRPLSLGLLCTVGQCEPKVIVNNPKSKSYLEDNKLLLKAWVLRTAMTNPMTDVKRLKKVARKKFYPVIPEKEITAVLKQMENTSIFSMRPQALEKMVQATIKPEVVCSLESTRAQKFRIKSRGISRLMSHEGISVVSSILQQQENHFNSSVSASLDKLSRLRKTYQTRLSALNVDPELINTKLQLFNIPLQEYSLYGHLPHESLPTVVQHSHSVNHTQHNNSDNLGNSVKPSELGESESSVKNTVNNVNSITQSNINSITKSKTRLMSEVVNYIEKMLKLTTWNITNDVKMVLKGNGQFSLYGLGDPSNCGLAISLIKRQLHTNINTNMGSNIYNISITGNNYEDLRKLSMEELSKRLLLYGVSEAIIKTLPRWDQVALVRQYRDGFGMVKNFEDSNNKFRIPPQEYQLQLNNIVRKQKLALQFDNLGESVDLVDVVEQDDTDLQDELVNSVNTVEQSGADNGVDKELEELKLLKESINLKKNLDSVIEDSNLIPVPGLMWLRQSRKTPSEPFSNERAVFVYGRENILKVLKWRKRCIEKKTHIPHETSFINNLNNNFGKRICRNCGQSGHIASNPKCPLYSGDKVKHESAYTKQVKKELEADTSDDEIITQSHALITDTRQFIVDNISKYRSVLDSVNEVNVVDVVDGVDAAKKRKKDEDETDQQQIHTSDLKIINKIIISMEKENRYKPFINKIPESIAPNYYKIIQRPVWLSLIKLRIRNKYYLNINSLVQDILLLEINCKMYNSEQSQNAWLRQTSQQLVDDLIYRISSHIQNQQQVKTIQQLHLTHLNQYRNVTTQ